MRFHPLHWARSLHSLLQSHPSKSPLCSPISTESHVPWWELILCLCLGKPWCTSSPAHRLTGRCIIIWSSLASPLGHLSKGWWKARGSEGRMPCIMGTAASSPRQSPWKRTQAHLKAALAVAMYRMPSGLPESSAPPPPAPPPTKEKGTTCGENGLHKQRCHSSLPCRWSWFGEGMQTVFEIWLLFFRPLGILLCNPHQPQDNLVTWHH